MSKPDEEVQVADMVLVATEATEALEVVVVLVVPLVLILLKNRIPTPMRMVIRSGDTKRSPTGEVLVLLVEVVITVLLVLKDLLVITAIVVKMETLEACSSSGKMPLER